MEFLSQTPLAGLMLVVALGFLLGRATWRGVCLGPAGGTLFVALALGSFGLDLERLYGGAHPAVTVGRFGFALFIYSVGFDAGAGFFAALRSGRGWRMVVVGVLVNAFAILTALACAHLFDFDSSTAAGVLAGALTSAPTLAAVSEICADSAALAVGFAVTYPLGLVGLVVIIQTLPRVLRQEIASEADSDLDLGFTGSRRSRLQGEREITRAFRVARAQVIGKSLAQLDLTHKTGCFLTRIHRGESILIPDASSVLAEGDHILAMGRVDEHHELEAWVGPEVSDDDLRERLPPARRVRVASPNVVGRTLADLDLIRRFRCLITAIERSGRRLEPDAGLVLERGDLVDIVGSRASVRGVARELGRFEPSTHETDIAVYAGGILIGLALGSFQLDFGRFHFTLGVAGGLLLTGLVLGRWHRIGPFSAHVPPAARQLVRDLGILLFVSEMGVDAGQQLVETVRGNFAVIFASGALVSFVPVLLALLVGRFLLRMRAIDTWGSVAGGMTSSAALLAVRRAADSDEPAIAYAAAYAVAAVIATLAGHVLVFLLA